MFWAFGCEFGDVWWYFPNWQPLMLSGFCIGGFRLISMGKQAMARNRAREMDGSKARNEDL